MKHLTRRTLSILLVMALCVSLLSGLVFAQNTNQVNYVTGNATGFNNVIKNWGQRGTTATFLSPNAVAFYDDNNVTYNELSKLSGNALYQELQDLMASNHKVITSYGDTRDLYRFTDCQNSDSSSISSFYSGVSIGPKWDSGATWNREHTWPNSKGLNGSDEDDIMMLRPTASSENSSRGNKAYGESSAYYDPNDLSGGKYDLHGDVARIVLYTHVRWGNKYLYGTSGVIESKNVLLKWMAEDPVDTWEMGRNDSVESITGTRNVFVDYPELAFAMLNESVPSGMVTPSGSGYSGYTITARANNSALGSVTVNGTTITAFPAEGCGVTGYTIASGSAKVSQNGNVFTVNASSDCTIYINFEAKDSMTVSFMENGTAAGFKNVYYGDVITLPVHSGKVADGYSFEGWVTAKVNETSKEPDTFYAAGTRYTVKNDVTLYALYSRVDENGTGQSNIYNIYSGAPVAGDYLIVSDGGALKASVTKNRFDITNVTINAGSIVNPAADIIWHIQPTGDGKFTIYNEASGNYAGGSGAKSQGKLLSSVTDYAKWTISNGQVFENLGNKNSGVNYTLRRNADFGFACYAASHGTGMTLYKLSGGTVYYTTSIGGGCQHVNTSNVSAVAPSCTQGGFTAGVYCKDCKSYISGHEKVGSTGHNYKAVVTPATENEKGYTTYTCSNCSDSYVSDYTEVLKGTYDVSFSVPFGVAAVETMACGTKGITLPTAGTPASEYEYTFLGWVMAEVDNSDAKPEILKAGSNFTTDADAVLYALYSYMPDGAAGTVCYTTMMTCVHRGQFVPAVSADCQNAGTIAHYLCDGCGKYFGDHDFTEKLDSIVDPQKDHVYGDFKSDVNGHWKTCGCGAKGEEGTHVYGEWTVTVQPAEGVDGSREHVCDTCGYKQTEVVPGESISEPVPEPVDETPIVIWIAIAVFLIVAAIVTVFILKKYGKI